MMPRAIAMASYGMTSNSFLWGGIWTRRCLIPFLLINSVYSSGHCSGTRVLCSISGKTSQVVKFTNKIVLSSSWERWSKFDSLG